MKQCLLTLFIVLVIAGSFSTARANFYLSTQNDSVLAGVPLDKDDVIHYDQSIETATRFFNGDHFSANENIDALHVMGNGDLVMVISTTLGATLGGTTFKDGDLVLYDPKNDTASFYFEEDDHFKLTEDIDALSILDSGNLILSTSGSATLGDLDFGNGDLVEYNPTTQTASIIFSEALFGALINIDAVHVNVDGTIVLSTAVRATLGGLTFDEDDLVIYDPTTLAATLLFDGNRAFSLQENIDAISMTPVPVSGAIWLFGSAVLGMIGQRKIFTNWGV